MNPLWVRGGDVEALDALAGVDVNMEDRHGPEPVRQASGIAGRGARVHPRARPQITEARRRAKRPDQKALDWQKLLVDHGYVARTIPREYGGYGAEPDVLEAAVIAAEFAAAGIYAG